MSVNWKLFSEKGWNHWSLLCDLGSSASPGKQIIKNTNSKYINKIVEHQLSERWNIVLTSENEECKRWY